MNAGIVGIVGIVGNDTNFDPDKFAVTVVTVVTGLSLTVKVTGLYCASSSQLSVPFFCPSDPSGTMTLPSGFCILDCEKRGT